MTTTISVKDERDLPAVIVLERDAYDSRVVMTVGSNTATNEESFSVRLSDNELREILHAIEMYKSYIKEEKM